MAALAMAYARKLSMEHLGRAQKHMASGTWGRRRSKPGFFPHPTRPSPSHQTPKAQRRRSLGERRGEGEGEGREDSLGFLVCCDFIFIFLKIFSNFLSDLLFDSMVVQEYVF